MSPGFWCGLAEKRHQPLASGNALRLLVRVARFRPVYLCNLDAQRWLADVFLPVVQIPTEYLGLERKLLVFRGSFKLFPQKHSEGR